MTKITSFSKGDVIVVVESPSCRGALATTLCDKICQWHVGRFSPGSPISSTNKTDSRYNWNIVESGVKHHNPNPLSQNESFVYFVAVSLPVNMIKN